MFSAAVIGGAVALMIPAVRSDLAATILKGVAKLGDRYAPYGRQLPLLSALRSYSALANRAIPRAAQSAVATRSAAELLAKEGFQQEFIERLVRTSPFEGLLYKRIAPQEFLAHEEIVPIIKQALAGMPDEATANQFQQMLKRQVEALHASTDIVPNIADVSKYQAVKAAQAKARKMMAAELERMAKSKHPALEAFGIRPVRFGDVDVTTVPPKKMHPALWERLQVPVFDKQVQAIKNIAQDVLEPELLGWRLVLHDLPIGGLYFVGDDVVDLTRASVLMETVERWLRGNIQIPIAPGIMGISPFQLFPWRAGRLNKLASHIGRVSRDPVAKELLGVPEEATDLGIDLFKIGNRFFTADFTEADKIKRKLGGVIQDVLAGEDVELRSGLWGYTARRARQILRAQEAIRGREAGGGSRGLFGWLGVGRQAEESFFSRAKSVFTKFSEDSDWIPRVFQRILTAGPDELSPTDVRKAVGFLTSEGLPASVRKAILEDPDIKKLFMPEQHYLLRMLDNPQAVLQFLEDIAEHSRGGHSPVFTEELHELVGQLTGDRAAFFRRFERLPDRDLFGWNIFGTRPERTWADIARDAIMAEVEYRIAANTGKSFVERVAELQGISESDRLKGLVFGYGRVLRRLLNPPAGTADIPLVWPGLQGQQTARLMGAGDPIAAVSWLRGSTEAQEVIEQFISRVVKPFETHVPSEAEFLRSSELLVKRGRSFIAELNERIKGGEDWMSAFWNTVSGPWARQYGAFFTGRQSDITTSTLLLEYFPRRLNELFSELGLGLPPEDLYSGWSTLRGLFLKRVLPAYAGVEAYRYLDYRSESYFGSGLSDFYANLRSRLGLFRARVAGEGGLLGDRDLYPGLERILPTRTVEEEREHQKEGYEPVRRGRFWLIGSRSQFFGDRIEYFAPSAVRSARSGWQRADDVDLNNADYWRRSIIPLPENFLLGPLRFLADPYDWEQEHAMGPNPDRPYPVSAPPWDPVTAHGPILNALFGRFIKPRRVLHPEYLPRRLGGSAVEEDIRRINEAVKLGADLGGINAIVGSLRGRADRDSNVQVLGSPGVLPFPGVGGGGGRGEGYGGGYGGGYGVGGGGGGGEGGDPGGSLVEFLTTGRMQIESPPLGMDGGAWDRLGQSSLQRQGFGRRLSHREIEAINRMTRAGVGGVSPMKMVTALRMARSDTPFSEEDMDLVDFESGTIQGMRNVVDIAGLYGYMAETTSPLEIRQRGPVVPTPMQAIGYNRRFWDLGLGGLGGSLSEVGRRFIPRRPRVDEEWNPIPNNMPSWLPGADYFIDFRHGDPYAKIPRGAMRLPGEAYLRLNPKARLMWTRASSLGKSVPELMRSMLYLEEPLSEYGEEVTEEGTEIHRLMQAKWKRMGVLVGAEGEIVNEKLGITGHYDAILRTTAGLAVTDIKSVSDKRFRQVLARGAHSEHADQLTFYMHELGIPQGFITYVNREKPWEVQIAPVPYSQRRFEEIVGRVEEARRRLARMADRGLISIWDTLDPVSRFEIVGDVAPYSEQYAHLREYLAAMNRSGQLSEDEKKRVQAVKKRVAQVKRRVDVYPYRFKNLDLESRTFTVKRIIDANTISVYGQEEPIRLAGVRSSSDRIVEVFGQPPGRMSPAEHQFRQMGVRPGTKVRVLLEGDESRRVSDDTLGTMRGVIIARGVNVNRELLRRGVAVEKEGDWSDTGVAARFSESEIRRGSLWEMFAHIDSPFHNKLLKVRSPLEQLERGIVYGKDTGTWRHPIRDYISPTVTSYVARNPIGAALGLGLFASFFGITKPAKKSLFLGGAAVGAALSGLRAIHESMTGEVWKPERTRRREELEEYWDILKYVKYRRLAAIEERLAREREGVNVERMVRQMRAEGRRRERLIEGLVEEKRRLLRRDPERNRERIEKINQRIEELQLIRPTFKLGPHATRALMYRQAFRSTLYGIDPGEADYLSIFRAMPKYKRELLQGWIQHSDVEERKRIFMLLPRQEQRVLGHMLGVDPRDIPDRPKLEEYFRRHPLPGPDWEGWSPAVSIENLQMRAIRAEGLDPMESGIYDLQIDEAEVATHHIPVPTMEGSTTDIQRRLNEVISGRGLRNVSISVSESPSDDDGDDIQLALRIRQRREREIMEALGLR